MTDHLVEAHLKFHDMNAPDDGERKVKDMIARYLAAVERRLPDDAAKDIIAELREAIDSRVEAKEAELGRAAGDDEIAAVLKDFGPNPPVGLLSFPREGTTLALDFRNQGEATLRLMADLDRIVASAGGRLYPAKDGRIPAALFQSGFPKWQDFREHVDPGLSSGFWRRVSA